MKPSHPPSLVVGRPVVLCIEDNPAQLCLLNEILTTEGFHVLQASTAENALEMMREAPVSLVISDHFLRGERGTDLAGKLKALKPMVPILLHSGAQPEMRNADAFVNKGQPVHEFLAVVRDLVVRFSS